MYILDGHSLLGQHLRVMVKMARSQANACEESEDSLQCIRNLLSCFRQSILNKSDEQTASPSSHLTNYRSQMGATLVDPVGLRRIVVI